LTTIFISNELAISTLRPFCSPSSAPKTRVPAFPPLCARARVKWSLTLMTTSGCSVMLREEDAVSAEAVSGFAMLPRRELGRVSCLCGVVLLGVR